MDRPNFCDPVVAWVGAGKDSGDGERAVFCVELHVLSFQRIVRLGRLVGFDPYFRSVDTVRYYVPYTVERERVSVRADQK